MELVRYCWEALICIRAGHILCLVQQNVRTIAIRAAAQGEPVLSDVN